MMIDMQADVLSTSNISEFPQTSYVFAVNGWNVCNSFLTSVCGIWSVRGSGVMVDFAVLVKKIVL
jgi:hypothetical protein